MVVTDVHVLSDTFVGPHETPLGCHSIPSIFFSGLIGSSDKTVKRLLDANIYR